MFVSIRLPSPVDTLPGTKQLLALFLRPWDIWDTTMILVSSRIIFHTWSFESQHWSPVRRNTQRWCVLRPSSLRPFNFVAGTNSVQSLLGGDTDIVLAIFGLKTTQAGRCSKVDVGWRPINELFRDTKAWSLNHVQQKASNLRTSISKTMISQYTPHSCPSAPGAPQYPELEFGLRAVARVACLQKSQSQLQVEQIQHFLRKKWQSNTNDKGDRAFMLLMWSGGAYRAYRILERHRIKNEYRLD